MNDSFLLTRHLFITQNSPVQPQPNPNPKTPNNDLVANNPYTGIATYKYNIHVIQPW